MSEQRQILTETDNTKIKIKKGEVYFPQKLNGQEYKPPTFVKLSVGKKNVILKSVSQPAGEGPVVYVKKNVADKLEKSKTATVEKSTGVRHFFYAILHHKLSIFISFIIGIAAVCLDGSLKLGENGKALWYFEPETITIFQYASFIMGVIAVVFLFASNMKE